MKKTLLLAITTCLLFVSGNAQFSIQKVLLEEFTGAWCGWCVDGAVRADDVKNSYANAHIIAIHSANGDPMEIADGATLTNFYMTTGFPEGILNRQGGGLSRTQWKSNAQSQLMGASAVTVSFSDVSYNSATRQLSATVKADFTGPINTGDLRFNLFISENNITGGGAYNQSNYDNGTPGHPYQGAGNPIVGFSHQHVLRAMLGGVWGTSGQIQMPVNFGSTADYTYTTTLPAGWDENEIHLIGVVQEFNGSGLTQRAILNIDEVPLITVTERNGHIDDDVLFVDAYPNPTTDRTTVAFSLTEHGSITVEVMNTMGQQVAMLLDGYMNPGAHSAIWDASNVPNGTYLIRVKTETNSITKRVIVAK